MHQYHLGINEEEREGELVVSKIFYQTQPRQCVSNTNWSDHHGSKDVIGIGVGDEISSVAATLQSLGSGDVVSRVNMHPHTRSFDEVYTLYFSSQLKYSYEYSINIFKTYNYFGHFHS